MLEKSYRPKEVEEKFYTMWEESGAFAADSNSTCPPFTLMMPPPNVTGSLHIGHALNFTLQDILIRFMRMRGRDALWQPGTDHAGIATQMVVEAQLAGQGIFPDRGQGADGTDANQKRIGREDFVGNDGNGAPDDGQHHVFPHQIPIALVVGMDSDTGVPKHGFGPGRGDDDVLPIRPFQGISEMPEMAVGLDLLNLEVADRGL